MKPEKLEGHSGHHELTNGQSQLADNTLVQLGFIGACPYLPQHHVSMTPALPLEQERPTIEEAPFEVNKVGGKPIWLNPHRPMPSDRIMCEAGCGQKMALLLQLFTPEAEQFPDAYHKVVYVYCCKNGACHAKIAAEANSSFEGWRKCFRVFRAQLPRENQIYDANMKVLSMLGKGIRMECAVCGCWGPLHCGRCKGAKYCSAACQHEHWTKGGHKKACESGEETLVLASAAWRSKTLFPEWDVLIDVEREEDAKPSADLVTSNMSTLQVQSCTEGGNDDSDEDAMDKDDEDTPETNVVDRAFLTFQTRTNRDPEQILRYVRVNNEDSPELSHSPNPLWASDVKMPSNVPNCPLCGGSRTFEFQIMPQLLNHLDINHALPDSLDWGTVAIFSCANSCTLSGSKKCMDYAEELVWSQPFSLQGMGDEQRAAFLHDQGLDR